MPGPLTRLRVQSLRSCGACRPGSAGRDCPLASCRAGRNRRHLPVAHAVAVGAAHRLRCDARHRGRGAELAALTTVRCARPAAPSQITKRAARADPGACASRRPRNRARQVPPAATSDYRGSWGTSVAPAEPCPGGWRRAWRAPRNAGRAARARERAMWTDLPPRVRAQRTRVSAASSAAGRRTEYRRGVAAARRPPASRAATRPGTARLAPIDAPREL